MYLPEIKFKNYKSFGDDWSLLDSLSNINVLIGRNNAGKSSVLDIIESLTDANVFYNNSSRGASYAVNLGHTITEKSLMQMFPSNSIYFYDRKAILEQACGMCIEFSVNIEPTGTSRNPYKYKYERKIIQLPFEVQYAKQWNQFYTYVNTFEQYKFIKLSAERNILPEEEVNLLNLTATGDGATNIVQTFILDDNFDEKLIEEKLLHALNRILAHDAQYDNIRIQRIENKDNDESKTRWEIFLEENEKRYALSKMGSGLKTILLVLINLLILPEMQNYKNSKIIFAFEELENNLHPALQRRLFEYLYYYSSKKDAVIFLTTHSHVAINLFADKDIVRIFHVKKEDGVSVLEPVEDYIGKSQILEDLDVKASDLLQSNGIIWVEGPSDRIYIKKWIELCSDEEFKEGRDYQFLYYGGRLLAHYSTEEAAELINILTTNRHAAIVIDSDKKSQSAKINDTKKRIKDEFQKRSLFCWITRGKEIENYIKYESLQKAFNSKKINSQCGPYELFPTYIESKYKKLNDKVEFARKVTAAMTADDTVTDILDLRKEINCLIEKIKSWNSN